MNYQEYQSVKNLNYAQYCDYLKNKYGMATANYFFPSWNKNKKVSRTKEGLIAHHIYESKAFLLSNPDVAKRFPYEWQKAENLVYCDYLEHLLLHILLSEEKELIKTDKGDDIYISRYPGGILQFLIPELNGVYSGWITAMQWRRNCYDKIINDKDVYLLLVKRFKVLIEEEDLCISEEAIYVSYNEQYGLWSSDKNQKLYNEIKML